MPATDTLYSARATSHECLEKGRVNNVQQRVYDAGALVSPSSGTLTVYNASQVAVLSGVTVDLTGSIANYDIPAATFTDEPYGEGWILAWALVMPDGTTRNIRRTASLVVSRLHPPAVAADLFGRLRALDPTNAHPITALTLAEFDDYLDSCWLQIEEKLRRKGRRPWLILSGEALRELQIVGTIALIFEDLATRNQAAFGDKAAYYREQWRVEWADARFQYLEVDSSTGSADTDQVGSEPAVWLQSFGEPVSPNRWG